MRSAFNLRFFEKRVQHLQPGDLIVVGERDSSSRITMDIQVVQVLSNN